MRKILVIRPNHRLGNLVLLTPFMQDLQSAFPQAQVDLVVGGGVAGKIFLGYPRVKVRYAFPGKSYREPAAVLRVLREIRREHYDLAIDPSPKSASSRFLLRVARADRKMGYRWRRWLRDRCLTHSADRATGPQHFSLEPGKLLFAAMPELTAQGLAQATRLDIVPSAAEKLDGQQKVARALGGARRPGPIIGFYALATAAKHYSPDWWSAVVAVFRARFPQANLIEVLAHDGQVRIPGGLPVIHSTELREFGGILATLDLLVTGDCGVMHHAAASGTRVVAAFKATDAVRYGPLGAAHLSVNASDADPQAFGERAAEHLRQQLAL